MNETTKKIIAIDTVILILLGLIFHFRSFEAQQEVYFLLSFFLLIGLVGCIIVDILANGGKQREEVYHYYKMAIIAALLICTVGTQVVAQISLRKENVYIHDGAVQVEESIKYLLQGKNFYSEDYTDTPLRQQERLSIIDKIIITNPALYHFAYLPFITIASVPFYLVAHGIFNWYDQRLVYIFFFILTLFILYRIPRELVNKRLAIIIFTLSPFNYEYLANGNNDIFVFFWIILSLFLLQRSKYLWSSLCLGIAVVSKQSAWLFVPFYLLYLIYSLREGSIGIDLKTIIKKVWQKTYPLFIVMLLVFVPFVIWDARSFIDDTIFYLSGASSTSFPINGYGFGFMVYKAGLVRSVSDYFPFWIVQFVVCLPLLYILAKWQRRNNGPQQIFINYGLFILIFWFLSRFFHTNYVNYALMIIVVAYFLPQTRQDDPRSKLSTPETKSGGQ